MMIKAQNAITHISDNEKINAENYMESLDYISNLYKFINLIKGAVSLTTIIFLPSFKGKYIVEKLGIPSTAKENEMKVFKVCSRLFLEDNTRKKVTAALNEICESIVAVDETMIFTLK